MHKQVGNTDVFYFTNLKSNDINTKIALRGKMNLELRDPHNGHIEEIEPAIEVIGNVTYSTFNLLLPRNRSVFVLGCP